MRPPEKEDSEELEKIRTLQRYFTRLPRAAFLFAESLSYTLRKEINQAILQKAEAAGKSIGLFSFEVNPDGGALDQLKAAKEQHPDGLIVENLDEVLDKGGEEWIHYINQLREGLFSLQIPLLFWVSPKTHQVLIRHAMDLYSRRDLASLYFEVPKEVEQADFLDRFPQISRAQLNFDGDKTRLHLLEKQWTQALSRGLNPERLAEEIGLALLQEYLRHYLLPEAENVWTTCQKELENLPQAWKVLSEYFEKTGSLDDAIFWQEKEKERAEKLGLNERVLDASVKLGDLNKAIGHIEKAEAFFEKTVDMSTEYLRGNPTSQNLKNFLAIAFQRLGDLHQDLGDLPRALVFFGKFNDLCEQLCKANPRNESLNNGLVISYSKLGDLYKVLGDLPKALDFFEKSNAMREELIKVNPRSETLKTGLAISYEKLGELHQALGNLPKALDFFEKRKDLGEELYLSNPRNESLKNGLAISYSKLGDLHQALGDFRKALDFFTKFNALCEELNQGNPRSESLKNDLAISYAKLGGLHQALGDLPKAMEFFEKRKELAEQLYQVNPRSENLKNGLGISYEKLGVLHQTLGNFPKALDFFEKALALTEQLFKANPNNQTLTRGLAISYCKMGVILEKMENISEALVWFYKALPLYEKIVAQSHLPEDEKWLGVMKEEIARLEQLPGNL